ncbi:MAG: Rap1a/Tai family immunity protein [Pseudomonadota bacterium]|nr:Rap1a/Tai family immunity protein [Pseudomonadota bacterium]
MSSYSKLFLIVSYLIILNFPFVYAEDNGNEELLTAGELLNSCEEGSTPGSPNQYCMRYLYGYIQTVLLLQQAEQSPPIFCINPRVTPIEEATDNMIAYLRNQSSRSNEPAQQIVLEGLNKNYPCATNKI